MVGILLALGALVCWGVGDFLIQRSARKCGDVIALFFIALIGAIICTPFIGSELSVLTNYSKLSILVGAALIMLLAALLIFESLRRGKLAVVEPIVSGEVVFTVLFAGVLLREYLSLYQWLAVVAIFIGIFLLATKSFAALRRWHAEKGAWLALAGTITMGGANFLFGMGAREASPLMVNWVVCVVIAIILALYLTIRKFWKNVVADWRRHRKLLISVGMVDNLGWLFYGFSVLYFPIGIAIGVSEGYIALAAILGLKLNREKLKRHQWAGLVVAVVAVVVLALITEN